MVTLPVMNPLRLLIYPIRCHAVEPLFVIRSRISCVQETTKTGLVCLCRRRGEVLLEFGGHEGCRCRIAQGVKVTEIARQCGVSRQTVYRLLGEGGRAGCPPAGSRSEGPSTDSRSLFDLPRAGDPRSGLREPPDPLAPSGPLMCPADCCQADPGGPRSRRPAARGFTGGVIPSRPMV